MPDAFDELSADFSGMNGISCPGPCLIIAVVVRKTFVSWTKRGQRRQPPAESR